MFVAFYIQCCLIIENRLQIGNHKLGSDIKAFLRNLQLFVVCFLIRISFQYFKMLEDFT